MSLSPSPEVVSEQFEDLLVNPNATVKPAEPVTTSPDGLFDYYLSPHEGDDGVDLHVAGPRKGYHLPAVVYRDFASEDSAMAWVAIHAESVDLRDFRLLRASRAMHQWARQCNVRLSLPQVEDLSLFGGSVADLGPA